MGGVFDAVGFFGAWGSTGLLEEFPPLVAAHRSWYMYIFRTRGFAKKTGSSPQLPPRFGG